jgi:hypothetical protein
MYSDEFGQHVEIRCGTSHPYAQGCLACGAASAWITSGLDGDSINILHAVGAEARGLFCATTTHALHAVLLLDQCRACQQEWYRTELDLIANPAISQAWAHKYFHGNERIEESPVLFTIAPRMPAPDIPQHWRLERLATPEGILERHILGPFQAEHSLCGWNGISRCDGDRIWENAAALCGCVLRLVTGA